MLRSSVDQNQQLTQPAVTAMMTDTNHHEVRCGMCSRELYVDDNGYSLYMEALNSGLDNPFLCAICDEEYDDLAYEG